MATTLRQKLNSCDFKSFLFRRCFKKIDSHYKNFQNFSFSVFHYKKVLSNHFSPLNELCMTILKQIHEQTLVKMLFGHLLFGQVKIM